MFVLQDLVIVWNADDFTYLGRDKGVAVNSAQLSDHVCHLFLVTNYVQSTELGFVNKPIQ